MQPNEGFGETVLRTFFKVFAAMMALVFSGIVGMVILGAVAGALVSDTAPEQAPTEYQTISGDDSASVTVASIPIEGVILGEPNAGDVYQLFGQSGLVYGYDVKNELQKLADDDSVDGVILEIHLPGGTIFGAQAIVDGVAAYRAQTGKPVYAYVGSIAASGGYWVAASADSIIADHGVSVGSIGVISGPFKYYDSVVSENGGAFLGGVVTEKGITTSYITAGTSKDVGNPYRQMTEDEVSTMQRSVNNAYDNFVQYVSGRRQISVDEIKSHIGAMIYDEQQGMELHLVDQIGNKDEAYQQLADQINPGADFKVERLVAPHSLLERVLLSAESLSGQTAPSVSGCPLASSVLAFQGDVASLCR